MKNKVGGLQIGKILPAFLDSTPLSDNLLGAKTMAARQRL
jgi:hypothetical protein